jgi:hypothetical protein
MLLHNFIIDNREFDESSYFENFDIPKDKDQSGITAATGEEAKAIATDNDALRVVGRPSNIDTENRLRGEKLREKLTMSLAMSGLTRPLHNDMRYNSCGHIYFS